MGQPIPKKNQRLTIVLSLSLFALMGFAVWLAVGPGGPKLFVTETPGDQLLDDALAQSSTEGGSRLDGKLAPGDEVIGGVERPASDVAPLPSGDGKSSASGVDPFDYGTTPATDPNANEQVQAVVEAIKTGRHPERLTVGVASKTARNFSPEKFDPRNEAYDQEYRDAYLRSPEPGRVWFPAQPGPGVERIQPLMPRFVKVNQGEDITLRVSGEPGQPVTFTSFDLGQFENELTTMTVVANEQGVAEAIFRGPPGTVDDVKIMAASPVLSGQVRLTVHIVGPNDFALNTPQGASAE